jgi:hypothetical protein
MRATLAEELKRARDLRGTASASYGSTQTSTSADV